MRRLSIMLICLSAAAWMSTLASAAQRPNILFVFADDWGRYASIYAEVDGAGSMNDAVSTPHFDRLAREGALFKNAFVTAPSCTPCRSSLLSGQYFYRTGRGAILQGARWDADIPAYPLLLREAGYHIGKTYKVWSPGQPSDAPYDGQNHAYERSGRGFNSFSQNVTQRVKEGLSFPEAKEALLNEVEQNFLAFLKDRDEGQPFCYWFGPTLTHRKWVRGSGKSLWGIDPDQLQGKLPKFLPDVPVVREDLADYFGEIQALDASLGRLTALLKAQGELDQTWIVVSGDHGAPGFPRGKCNLYDFGVAVPLAVRGPGIPGGRVLEDFVNLMDLAPTFLEAAGLTPPKIMTGRSLIPVLQSSRQGLVDPYRTWVVTGRERHVAKARTGNLPYPQRAIRTREALYIINFAPDRWPMGNPLHLELEDSPGFDQLANNTFVTFPDLDASPTKAWLVEHQKDPATKAFYDLAFAKRPREELYLLAQDPDQIHNLADDPNHSSLKRNLHNQLMAELSRTEDPRIVNQGALFDNPPYAGEEGR